MARTITLLVALVVVCLWTTAGLAADDPVPKVDPEASADKAPTSASETTPSEGDEASSAEDTSPKLGWDGKDPTKPLKPVGPEERPLLVGVDVGVAVPFTELQTTFNVELEVGYRFFFDGRLGLSFVAGYTRPTTEGEVTYQTGLVGDEGPTTETMAYTTALDAVGLSLHIFFRVFDDTSSWTPWLAVGPSMTFMQHTVESFESTNVESAMAYGLLSSVGVDVLLGPGALTGIVRIPWALIDTPTLGDSHLGAATIQLGYRLMF